MRTIFTDESVFSQIKEKGRNAYIKSWEDFKNYLTGHNFEECHPGEEDIISFFNHLRLEKKMATSSIWMIYSHINSITKRKYGWKLQSLPRITMTIKGYKEDTKNKTAIFEEDNLRRFWTMKMDSAYWMVRWAIAHSHHGLLWWPEDGRVHGLGTEENYEGARGLSHHSH